MYSMKHLSTPAAFLVLSFFSFTMMATTATDSIVLDERDVVTTIQVDGNAHLTEAHVRDGKVVIAVAEDAKFEAESVTAYASVTLHLSGNAQVNIDEVRTRQVIVHAKENSSVHISDMYVGGVETNVKDSANITARILVSHKDANIRIYDNAGVIVGTFWAKKLTLTRDSSADLKILNNANIPTAHIHTNQSGTVASFAFLMDGETLFNVHGCIRYRYSVQHMTFGGTGEINPGLRQLWKMSPTFGGYNQNDDNSNLKKVRQWAKEIYEGGVEYSCYNYRDISGAWCGIVHTPQSTKEVEDALLERSILPFPDQYLNKDLCDFLDLDGDGSLYEYAKQYAERCGKKATAK